MTLPADTNTSNKTVNMGLFLAQNIFSLLRMVLIQYECRLNCNVKLEIILLFRSKLHSHKLSIAFDQNPKSFNRALKNFILLYKPALSYTTPRRFVRSDVFMS